MSLLQLIPSATEAQEANIEDVAHELFQDVFESNAINLSMSTNFAKSYHNHSALQQASQTICQEILYEKTLNDIHFIEEEILKTQENYLRRNEKIRQNQTAAEIIRLKRQPIYRDLDPDFVKKFNLLQSDDMLPERHECIVDFRLNKEAKKRMKDRLMGSNDMYFEIPDCIPQSKYLIRTANNEKVSKKPRSTQNIVHPKINQSRKRGIIKSDVHKTILVADPQTVQFRNFKANVVYNETVIIKNISANSARFQIESRQKNSKFTFMLDPKYNEKRKIAPGMHVKLIIFFRSDVLEEAQEHIIVNVQFGKPVVIGVNGYREPPMLRAVNSLCRSQSFILKSENISTSKSIRGAEELASRTSIFANIGENETKVCALSNANLECKKCFVGEQIVVMTKLKNVGGEGRFFIMTETDWCSMHVDGIMDTNIIIFPPFSIKPAYFALQPNEIIELHTYFCPESYGMQVDKLYIVCDNCSVQSIEVIGDGIVYEPDFIRFGKIETVQLPEYVNDELAKYFIDMGEGTPDEVLKSTVFIYNTSDLEIFYRWEKRKVEITGRNETNDWKNFPLECLDIQTINGTFPPDSVTSFKVIARITDDLPPNQYCAVLQLYVEDIPLAAIPNKYHLKVQNSKVNRRKCLVSVDVLIGDIEVWVQCMPAKLHLPSDIIEDSTDDFSNDEKLNIATENQCGCSSSNDICDQLLIKDERTSISSNDEADAQIIYSQLSNIAILRPGRRLYVGVKETYSLMICNVSYQPAVYLWGQAAGLDESKTEISFDPKSGEILAGSTKTVIITCLPMETGIIEFFFVPCYAGKLKNPVMLGIECIVDSLNVTFHFLPATNMVLPPGIDMICVEWHLQEERELMNIDLDLESAAGDVSVDSSVTEIVNNMNDEMTKMQKLSPYLRMDKTNEMIEDNLQNDEKEELGKELTMEKEEEALIEFQREEDLLQNIVQTEDQQEKYIPPPIISQAVLPFYKTVLPPIRQPIVIEFLELPLRIVEKKTFVIRNETPITSAFSINIKNFYPVYDTRRKESKCRAITAIYATVMGHKLANDDWNRVKQQDSGVVLVVEPSTGYLRSFEAIHIDMYVYADTWGTYMDEVTVNIIGLPPYTFEIYIQVDELPISFPICKNVTPKIPLLRFGAMRFGACSSTRKILLENTSILPLTINWHCFLAGSANSMPFNVVLDMFSIFTDEGDALIENSPEKNNITTIQQYNSNQSIQDLNKFKSIETSSTDSTDNSSYTNRRTNSTFASWTDYQVQHKSVVSSEFKNDSREFDGRNNVWSKESVDHQETKIKLSLVPYYGETDCNIFTIYPREIFIRAREKKWITITINPKKFPVTNSKYEIFCKVLGFIQIAPIHKYRAECFSRQDGYFLSPVEINLQAKAVRPKLVCNATKSERTFKIYIAAVMEHLKKEIQIKRKYLFYNDEEETVHVNFESTKPFDIRCLSTLRGKVTPEDAEGFLLNARESIEVEVVCTINSKWIEGIMEMNNTQNLENLAININRILSVIYVGSWTQEMQLYLKLFMPQIKLSSYNLNFGHVQIRSTKKLILTIENVSGDKQWFRIRKTFRNDDFAVHPNQGVLPAHPATGNYALNITVFYTPSEPENSTEKLEICTSVPGYMKECTLYGQGSLNEKYYLSGM